MKNVYKLSASALALVAMSGTPVFAQHIELQVLITTRLQWQDGLKMP